ncbi:MAG TPA: ABC transporter permease [Papillibacter sp.]|jgi:peptide/nickel transport system permease protein|nr:ABC transporter permease [Papillibacter sp.]
MENSLRPKGHSLGRYALRRLLLLIPVLFGVTLLTYGLMFLSPSDPVEMLLQAQGIPVSPEVVSAMRVRMGLDRPFLEQYFAWLWRFLRGDMGVSLIDGEPVWLMLKSAIPRTLLLTASSVLVTVVLSVPLGVLTAVRQNRFSDYLIRFLSFLGNAMPSFLLSLLLLYLFALRLGLLPVLAGGSVKGLILPTLALALPMSGRYIRQVRAAILEQLGKRYVAGAISRGVRARTVLIRSVLRNAMTTILTLISLSVGSLLGGTAAVERIFAWRGMGYMVMDAIFMRDYPVIQAFVVWMTILYVVINLLTDLSYALFDPRARKGLGVRS